MLYYLLFCCVVFITLVKACMDSGDKYEKDDFYQGLFFSFMPFVNVICLLFVVSDFLSNFVKKD